MWKSMRVHRNCTQAEVPMPRGRAVLVTENRDAACGLHVGMAGGTGPRAMRGRWTE